MNYTVTWIPEAEAELTRLWIESRARVAMAAAVDIIDRALGSDPLGVGESRDGNRRILMVWPLALSYVVKPEDRIVQVNNVWRYE